ncbi:MAG: alkaline phosphatase family protein [Actinomycetota bacterium]|nr:alkaline phosphatase family protein [Actinomycetota bacterium]
MKRLAAIPVFLVVATACSLFGDNPSFQQRLSCDVPRVLLQRQWRGYVPGRSGEILLIERLPNQFGTRHSTPHAYTQDVPLFLYGPGFIRGGVTEDRPVTLADIAPTYAELLDFDEFPLRDGRPLVESLLPADERNGLPRLIVTVVWDGAGDNVLDYWPEAWPHLRALMREGTMYSRATVGSSPSITPAVHATIGTGAFPSSHGIADIIMRVDGSIKDSWAKTSPRNLELPTFADMWDAAQDNKAKLAVLARGGWQAGMMGHGAYLEGGDLDIAVLDDVHGVGFRTRDKFYSMPIYLHDTRGLGEAITKIDRKDGSVDETWLGHKILDYVPEVRSTSAWPRYQTERIVGLLTKEGFGTDDVADLLFTNYKSLDLAHHAWNMVEPEVQDNLRAQDEQLAVLVRSLDRLVGRDNYVLALTADHGITPSASVTGGWSIDTDKIDRDIDEAFGIDPDDGSLVENNRGYQIFLDEDTMAAHDVTATSVAGFLGDYRIRDNITGEPPASFEGDEDQRLFLSALTPDGLKRSLACSRD